MLPDIDGPLLGIDRFGYLKYLDPPFTFYAMYLIYKLCDDVVVGIALTVILFYLLTSVVIVVNIH